MSTPWGKGTVIMGRYELVSLLGAGGMGSVWRAEHLQLRSKVAVKLLDPSIAQNEEMLARFLREARACATLKNRHIVQVYDHGVEDGTAFMVMELLHGETLGARLSRGVLSVEEAVKYMCQVMRAIGRAHDAGVIHRDLKPDNIFLCDDEDEIYAKVLDFGVAKVNSGELDHSEGVKTQTGMMIGTPFYMSPEQAKAKPVDQRTDVWALAVITYECLTGKRPYTGDSFAELLMAICSAPTPLPSKLASVPVGFDEWFVKGTQRDVERRFKSTKEMADELMQLANAPMVAKRDDPGATRAFVPAERTPAPARPNRLAMTTGQSASASFDSRRDAEGGGSKTALYAAAAATALALLGGGAYAFKATSDVATTEPEAVAAPAQPPAPSPVASAPAPQVEKPAAPPPAAPVASVTPPPTESEKNAAKPAADKNAKAVKPATSGPVKTTPSEHKDTLPPEKWEF